MYLITVEMRSALSAAVQARTTGEVVRIGTRGSASRAVSMRVMSISWGPPFSKPQFQFWVWGDVVVLEEGWDFQF